MDEVEEYIVALDLNEAVTEKLKILVRQHGADSFMQGFRSGITSFKGNIDTCLEQYCENNLK